MTTVFGSLFILVIFSFLALKIKKTFAQKKKECLDKEITNDLIEEFSDPCHSEEFLNWAEELQMEHDISQKSQ
ncbi:MAG TPA: hypothetical protein DCL00_07145 [Opitutae bacterium]|jgi:hypothetical protein|nr:hypothetical protein [Opitutae bacterium]HAF59348.1 hypothetical protein [Opitutae bacterium]|tara:strand:+ start:4536 stop:4754 length:219 start_codon:yes stop_codon:yes gene_type:complete